MATGKIVFPGEVCFAVSHSIYFLNYHWGAPKSEFLAQPWHDTADGNVGLSVSRSTTLVHTETSQQLLADRHEILHRQSWSAVDEPS